MTGPDPARGRGPAWRRDRVVVVGVVVAVVAIAVGLLTTATAPPPADDVVSLEDVGDLRDHVGDRVSAAGLEVDGVPADEGFWVDAGDRVWVRIATAGESPVVVEEGDRVTFTGTVVADGGPEDAEAHVVVDVADLAVD